MLWYRVTIHEQIQDMGRRALAASRGLALLSSATKNAILHAMADQLLAEEPAILEANALDIQAAQEKGLSGHDGRAPAVQQVPHHRVARFLDGNRDA